MQTEFDINKYKAHIYDVVGAIHEVHKELGPGLNEYCYLLKTRDIFKDNLDN